MTSNKENGIKTLVKSLVAFLIGSVVVLSFFLIASPIFFLFLKAAYHVFKFIDPLQ